jgi:Rrf2 family protein
VKLSAYAVNACYALAAAHRANGQLVRMKDVAAERGLSLAMLHKVTYHLVRGGLLAVQTGPRGGCRLGRPAKDITLLDIVEAVDGPVVGVVQGLGSACPQTVAAKPSAVCERVTEGNRKQLARVRLADLAGAADGEH